MLQIRLQRKIVYLTHFFQDELMQSQLSDKGIARNCGEVYNKIKDMLLHRENKSELKKLREAMERIEGEPSGIIDI